MNLKILFFTLSVLVGVLNANSANPVTLFIQQRAEDALQKQLLKSRSAPISRSSVVECHQHYGKLLDNLLNKYEQDLEQCDENRRKQIAELTNEGQGSRDSATGTLNQVCGQIDVCKAKDANLEFLDCVDAAGDPNSRSIWKASRDSAEAAARIREQERVIEFSHNKCNSAAEREYIVQSTKATDDMIACFNNEINVPTEPPATEPPATEPPATEPPATEPPATEPPATEPPATEPPATEPPATEPPATEPPATEPPATEPPATEPPATEPPATEPPATEPPATEPPATEPPATEPPATEPPATEPPATEPPATESPVTEPPEQPTGDEDQVEELERSNNRAKLENFMKNWGKRL